MSKRYFVTTAVLLMLIGCRDHAEDASKAGTPQASEPPVVAEASAAPKVTAPAAADPGKSCVGQPGCDDLPPGVEILVAHELRSGRIYAAANAAERRQFAFEIMEDDVAATLDAFKQSMVGAGFASGDLQSREDGVQGIRFNKDGYGVVNVWVNPSVGPKPVNAKAKFILGVDMPNAL